MSVGALADLLECTENDILRALRYWDKHGLISLEQSGTRSSPLLLVLPEHRRPELRLIFPRKLPLLWILRPSLMRRFPSRDSCCFRSAGRTRIQSDRRDFAAATAKLFAFAGRSLSNDVEIKKTITTVEQLLGTTISPSHLQNILYFMCDVGFSSDLVCAMYETAVNKGKKTG